MCSTSSSTIMESFSLDASSGIRASCCGLTLATTGSCLEVVLETPAHPSCPGERRALSVAWEEMRATPRPEGMRYSVDRLRLGDEEWAISIWVDCVLRDTELSLRVGVDNQAEGWYVENVHTPALHVSGLDAAKASLMWPNGLGQRYTTFEGFGYKEIPYPSGLGTMQWCALDAGEGGIYLGIHDETRMAKYIQAFADSADLLSLSMRYHPFCKEGESWESPALLLKPYAGTWHAAADIYRAWADTWLDLSNRPAWATNSTGWFLAILKQQNQQVLWSYNELDTVWQIAKERGLDTVGLFGWAHGGHDYLYPEYIPDPTMGGRSALKKAIARAHEMGIRVVLYANGQLMDTSTEFFRFNGNDAMLRLKNSEIAGCSIRKFNSSTPVMFAHGCPGSDIWRDKMLSLAEQANDLGADGILYDQMGVAVPNFCFATEHRHTSPAQSFAEERASMMHEIASHMRAKNPEFAVMTEGVIDMLLSDLPYYHGWGVGFNPSDHMKMFDVDAVFPEMFRYTFPEIAMTQRHATPMMDRHIANRTCVLGLRHEIEARYQPDVEYLETQKIPEDTAFSDCTYYPPDVQMMQATPADEATAYLQAMIAFRKTHADLLLTGKFLDTQGVTIENEALVAKAYSAGDAFGVVVWNPTDTPQDAVFSTEKPVLNNAFSPENGAENGQNPLPPHSIRLYRTP